MLDFLTLLRENPYPGRGILVSRDLVYYFIMGRSANSRNRIFVTTGDGIRTEAYDPAKLEDPSLIIYHPVRTFGRGTIVTKEMLGSETIYQIRYDGHSIMAKSLEDSFEQGSEVYIGVKKENILMFDENERRVRDDDRRYHIWLQEL